VQPPNETRRKIAASKLMYFIITSRIGLRLLEPPIDYTTCATKIKQRPGITSNTILTISRIKTWGKG
jgi:hypothetical protein